MSCDAPIAVLTHRAQMGMADRDYYRKASREASGPMGQLTPVVKAILLVNILLYFIDLLTKGDTRGDGPIREFGAFSIESAVFGGQVWEFITFQFIHGSFGHLLFNSIALFFFGPWMERWWGAKKFLIYYLLCGAAGAVFFTLLVFLKVLPHANAFSGLVGASAGIYGILVGVAVVAPNLRVALLIPPIELSMRQLAIALLVIAIAQIVLPFGTNQGGEAGHLGGAILGFILLRFPFLLGGPPQIKFPRPPVVFDQAEPKIRPRTAIEKDRESELDRILDKISSHGFQSLTDAERETLQKASNPRS